MKDLGCGSLSRELHLCKFFSPPRCWNCSTSAFHKSWRQLILQVYEANYEASSPWRFSLGHIEGDLIFSPSGCFLDTANVSQEEGLEIPPWQCLWHLLQVDESRPFLPPPTLHSLFLGLMPIFLMAMFVTYLKMETFPNSYESQYKLIRKISSWSVIGYRDGLQPSRNVQFIYKLGK